MRSVEFPDFFDKKAKISAMENGDLVHIAIADDLGDISVCLSYKNAEQFADVLARKAIEARLAASGYRPGYSPWDENDEFVGNKKLLRETH